MGRSLSLSFPNLMVLFSLLSLLFLPLSLSQSTCKSHTFSNKKTFQNCADLPTLNAALYWTFDAAKSTLSMAFTAKSDGWVAWGLNPTASGMMGTQALIGGKFAGATVSADTYDVQSYHAVVKGPISYNVTGISAEESADGEITIFGEWALPKGQSTFNQVWQVGPIVGGKPSKHDVQQPNLSSRLKLSLAGGSAAGAPAVSPAKSPEPESTSASPSGTIQPGFSMPPVPATNGAGEALFLSSGFGLGLIAIVVCSLF